MPFPVSLCVIVYVQVITLEGWVEIMYYVMDAHSFYNFIYFILLIIVSKKKGSPTHFGGEKKKHSLDKYQNPFLL